MPGFGIPSNPKPHPIRDLELHDRDANVLTMPSDNSPLLIRYNLIHISHGALYIDDSNFLGTVRAKKKLRIDVAPEQPRPIEAKLRALDKFVRVLNTFRGEKVDQGLSFEEAAKLEQREHVVDLERKQGLLEKRQKQGLVMFKGRVLTSLREEEAHRWAFTDYKPSESDVEDDDGNDLDDEDLSGSAMLKMTGGRIKTLLSPMLKIFWTSPWSIPAGFITTGVMNHETGSELEVALYHIRMIILRGADYPKQNPAKTWAEGDVEKASTLTSDARFSDFLLSRLAFREGEAFRLVFSPGRVASSPSTSSMSFEPSESTIKAVPDMKASEEEDADGTAK
ncbi:hypothetical protein EDB92DRAFT_2115655 [Lactarius akahatsu]|uniref:Uncharacterized protein n=1 Tax=Lactarius akahatsu TaxID=416441 RepID=A0AAD4QC87_9AGAM|nr:hypothetical protein EDB92DRAFT_2115655 [Lactarius akahatsu]